MDTQSILKALRDPRISLPANAKIIGQKLSDTVQYNPLEITHQLQSTILHYVAEPPKDAYGANKWMVLLGYRQGGKSLAAELAFYPLSMYTPGYDHVCMADKRERADYLHSRVHFTHEHWPLELRNATESNREVRQITFDKTVGGKMRTLTADGLNEGIGMSPDSFHGSEVPFWPDAGGVMNRIIPSMINRENSRVIMESTSAPGMTESVAFFKDIYTDGCNGRGRWLSVFFPFWDGVLNSRPWRGERMTNEELDLLHRHSKDGLREENLIFRRYIMETDPEIRRYPELFQVFYPFDDISCWYSRANAIIPHLILQKQIDNATVPWQEELGFIEIEPPEPGAIYACGVDPAGFGMRDHASFQIVKVYDDEIKQVYEYAKTTDPLSFARDLVVQLRRYNNAYVAIENNGVGAGTIVHLQEIEYPNLLHADKSTIGFNSNGPNNERYLRYLIDALMDTLVIKSKDLLSQMLSYKNDKRTERSALAELLTGDATGGNRRARHHWDKVSALIYAIVASRFVPTRYRSAKQDDSKQVDFEKMTYNEIEKYRQLVAKPQEPDKPQYRSHGPYKRFTN